MARVDKGTIIADRYELVSVVGEGGMAKVWRAVTRGAAGFSRPVAIKQIKTEYRALKHYVDMFVEEARVGSELAHPNIVQAFDFCVEHECYFLVMEWVDGLDLGAFSRAFAWMQQPAPWPLVAAVGMGVLRGLSAAHERRGSDGAPAPVVHRDVSPHNILLGVNGVVKLSDFGLARARDRLFSLTAPGTVKGKLSYLSPEITRGKSATPLSDQFSLGSVLWEVLAGRRLFDAPTDLDIFTMIRNAEVSPLEHTRGDVPPRLIALVHRALALDPEDRFPSARAMALELAGCLRETDEYFDSQALIATSVARARDTLSVHEDLVHHLAADDLDNPTWTFEVDVDTSSFRSSGGPQDLPTEGIDDGDADRD